MADRDYAAKRSFDQTPEPPPEVEGDVDVASAPPGDSFVIHQHHARRLHFDLRLEMLNCSTPVLVSWAVPKNLPTSKGVRSLAVKVEDHPFEYGSFSGSIPAGNYGAGEVRIFDEGTYELLEQAPGKLTIRLRGRRLQATWHLVRTARSEGKDWLILLREWEGPPREPPPPLEPMEPSGARPPFDDPEWAFEPVLDGTRAFLVWEGRVSRLLGEGGVDITEEHAAAAKAGERLVALNAVADGRVTGKVYAFSDLLYLDGRRLVDEPYRRRRELLEEAVVAGGPAAVATSIPQSGRAVAAFAEQQELPGVVAKRLDSRYVPGRSDAWTLVAGNG